MGIGILRIPLLEVLLVCYPDQPGAHVAGSAADDRHTAADRRDVRLLSLLAFGGGAAVLPDMQHQAVDVHHWVTAREFLDMFAMSRAVPPGSMIVVLVGQRAAGVAGGLVALLAMFGPSSLVAFAVARVWHRAGGRPGGKRSSRRWRRFPSA